MTRARVTVETEVIGQIGPGLLILLGVETGDSETDADYIAGKIVDLRLFAPLADDLPERSLLDMGQSALVVSQFTLLGDCRKGRRPSWSRAARPDEARQGYENVVSRLREKGIPTETGTFRAHMAVELTNDGPITVLLDSRKDF